MKPAAIVESLRFATGSACTVLRRAVLRLQPSRPRHHLGIVAHLAAAFVTVGAFAVAANLYAVYGTVFVTQVPGVVERVVYVPVPAPTMQPAAAPELESSQPIDASSLASAADQFARAVAQRVDDGGDDAERRFVSAAQGLTAETSAFARRAAPRVTQERLGRLARLGEAMIANAFAARDLADTRRTQAAEYRRKFESMESRMAGSLDKAWRIFGRVIARESLVELNQRLGDIRRHLDWLQPEAAAGLDAAPLAASEKAFREALDRRASSLADSQGRAWVADMRADCERLVAARSALAEAGQSLDARLGRLAETGAQFDALVESIAKTPARAPALPAAAKAETAPRAASLPQVGAASPPSASASLRDEAVASPQVRRVERSRPLAWLSVGVLILLLVVSTLMALRVILPVRELVAATRRIAEGRLEARVAGGGIRELDTLGASFNQMAERIADARAVADDYQQRLESRVVERTRQLRHLAEHDPLTELPNRRQLFAQLSEALAESAARGLAVGVMVLDLDNFKNINDTMGHSYGDRVLQEVAKRLESVVARSGFSARQGGDEFTIVCRAARGVDDVIAVGEAILQAFQEPLAVDGRALSVSVSLGIAAYPSHAGDADALMRAADAALFRAKALGRHRLSVFSPDLLEAAASRFRTEQGLRHAIERGEFELAFQPEALARTFQVPLVEALLRWRLPDGRLASPNDFLAVAEDSGMIVEISDWVLHSAIAAAARWRRTGWDDLRVAVNVSPRQVASPDFIDRLTAILDRAELPPRCIEIELTEQVLQTGEGTVRTLRELRNLGIGIALDDFGTGYSTLASLEQLPFSRVKLDRSLIARIDSAGRSRAIAQMIIDLCGRLGLEVTAEGVERPDQLDILARSPGILVQGYLLSPPLPAADLRREVELLPAKMASRILSSPQAAGTSATSLSSGPDHLMREQG